MWYRSLEGNELLKSQKTANLPKESLYLPNLPFYMRKSIIHLPTSIEGEDSQLKNPGIAWIL
jgi:hypothetical protein